MQVYSYCTGFAQYANKDMLFGLIYARHNECIYVTLYRCILVTLANVLLDYLRISFFSPFNTVEMSLT